MTLVYMLRWYRQHVHSARSYFPRHPGKEIFRIYFSMKSRSPAVWFYSGKKPGAAHLAELHHANEPYARYEEKYILIQCITLSPYPDNAKDYSQNGYSVCKSLSGVPDAAATWEESRKGWAEVSIF